MYRCYRHCCCHNNDNESIEKSCNDIMPDDDCNDSCMCGFDHESIFPMNPMLAQSYVPIQNMGETFTPCCGLKNGTIFPELVTIYNPGQSMRDIEYLKLSNEIGEGCNKCS